jgi:hypothetical protein
VQLSHGKALGRGFLSASTTFRGMAIRSGQGLAEGFTRLGGVLGPPRGESLVAARLAAFESTLRDAHDRDPTQPWHLFYLGQAAWWLDRRGEAERRWQELLATAAFPGIPYYEYARMASEFERLGQRQWADHAYREALRRRRQIPQPIGHVFPLERLFNTPFARGKASERPDLEREHLWLERSREFGLSTEGDDFAAALWARHFRDQGLTVQADAETEVRRETQRDPLNVMQLAARVDHAFQIYAALGLTSLAAALALLASGSRRRRTACARQGGDRQPTAVSFVLPTERRVLLIACSLNLLAAGLFLGRFHVLSRVSFLPAGFGDALGGAGVRDELERVVAETDSEGARFALAVSSHLAGRVDRARTLYETLLDDPRARRNLAALRSGSLVAPEPVGSEDLWRAYTALPWKAVPRAGLETGRAFAESLLVRGTRGQIVSAAVLGGLVPLVAGVLLLLVLLWSPVPDSVADLDRQRQSLVCRLVPGLADLSGGAPVRGYVALATGIFPVVAILTQLVYAEARAVGPASADAWPPGWTFPIPGRSSWVEFWTYRDTPYFWGMVLLAAAVSIGLHLKARRRHYAPWKMNAGGASGAQS